MLRKKKKNENKEQQQNQTSDSRQTPLPQAWDLKTQRPVPDKTPISVDPKVSCLCLRLLKISIGNVLTLDSGVCGRTRECMKRHCASLQMSNSCVISFRFKTEGDSEEPAQ